MEQQQQLIYQRISDALEESGGISKIRKNQQQGYSFRGIDDVYNALHTVLAKHKIFTTSEIVEKERYEWDTKNGGRMSEYVLLIRWRFCTTDGSYVTTETVGQAMDSGDKAANKAMSAAHKYAFLQIFAIPTEGDNDTENHSHEPARRSDPQPIATTKQIFCTEKQVELIRKVYKSHVVTQVERDRIEAKIADGSADGSAIIKWLETETASRKEVERQQAEDAAKEKLKSDGVI